ncbi:hypothetical protein LJC64_04370, partial [Ruminococcaceae bacterium OttesenSCG-928-A11]|nr:hypothetical protein [Ruminococcaceae bacterium OttesenSCG-928-A11]
PQWHWQAMLLAAHTLSDCMQCPTGKTTLWGIFVPSFVLFPTKGRPAAFPRWQPPRICAIFKPQLSLIHNHR